MGYPVYTNQILHSLPTNVTDKYKRLFVADKELNEKVRTALAPLGVLVREVTAACLPDALDAATSLLTGTTKALDVLMHRLPTYEDGAAAAIDEHMNEQIKRADE